ncbi:polyamine-modulated factor 1 isoform X2 [Octodon degus]|uniref:Polyamine-modulated factor 1 isoform X2 n=1 Tax=Octodon degus TaxID=10160 RepID=A0A6P6EAU9_OCTDE|nr:polyamine-modulated factor 1 isoform X2 [Octodon degus]
MAEAKVPNEAAGEVKPNGPSPESVPPGTAVSRVKLLDTMVDTFLQKLIAAGSYQRFTDCYKHFHQLQPEMTQRIYDKFVTQLQASIREEISEIKEEGNLETVLMSLDKIVEDGKKRKEPACSGTPSGVMCRSRRPRTRSWPRPSWQGADKWRSCSGRCRLGSRPGRLCTESAGSWQPC